MTLRPQVSPTSKQLARHKRDNKFDDQWEYLYGDSINKNKNLRKDHATDEVEFNKDPEAYTFQPNPERADLRRKAPRPEELSTNKRAAQRNQNSAPAGPEVFQINVNIKGQKKVITANTDSDPAETA